MKILFCDDDPRRFKTFMRNMIGTVVDWASKPQDAIARLKEVHYDVVFLDFDYDEDGLGYYGFGSDISKWIAEHPPQDTLLFIHSLNASGREMMHGDLLAVGLPVVVMPWAWEKVSPEMVEAEWNRLLKKEV